MWESSVRNEGTPDQPGRGWLTLRPQGSGSVWWRESPRDDELVTYPMPRQTKTNKQHKVIDTFCAIFQQAKLKCAIYVFSDPYKPTPSKFWVPLTMVFITLTYIWEKCSLIRKVYILLWPNFLSIIFTVRSLKYSSCYLEFGAFEITWNFGWECFK